jgi:5-methylcytosine-specific restriction protein A
MPIKPKAIKPLYNLPKKQSGQWSSNQDKFYHSTKWRKLRKQVLTINPLCVYCQKENKPTIATIADHITPVRLGGEVWELNNLQSLCESCHNKKSAKESKQYGNTTY